MLPPSGSWVIMVIANVLVAAMSISLLPSQLDEKTFLDLEDAPHPHLSLSHLLNDEAHRDKAPKDYH